MAPMQVGLFVLRCLGCVRRSRRTIHEGSIQRKLADDSESETEPSEHPCQAVCVGISTEAGMRTLSLSDCPDEGTGKPIRFLFEDAQASDLPPSVEEGTSTVALCGITNNFTWRLCRGASDSRLHASIRCRATEQAFLCAPAT